MTGVQTCALPIYGTAPKQELPPDCFHSSAITSQNGTAPKPLHDSLPWLWVRLPVRTALLQNPNNRTAQLPLVRLPVRTALLQNYQFDTSCQPGCDYQSERHCSKTRDVQDSNLQGAITSQNGTAPKLASITLHQARRAITSQNGTAPKLHFFAGVFPHGAITSQNGTAPKRKTLGDLPGVCAITSQNGTAPKLRT